MMMVVAFEEQVLAHPPPVPDDAPRSRRQLQSNARLCWVHMMINDAILRDECCPGSSLGGFDLIEIQLRSAK